MNPFSKQMAPQAVNMAVPVWGYRLHENLVKYLVAKFDWKVRRVKVAASRSICPLLCLNNRMKEDA